MKFCCHCNNTFSDEFSFCPRCGKSLETQFECPNCKKLVNGDFLFCPYCGTKTYSLEKDEQALRNSDQNNNTEKKIFEERNQVLEPGKREFELAEKYFYGNGVEENNEEAFKWYIKAAEQGNVEAQVKLGDNYRLYFYMNEDENDANEAIKWYTKAAEQGNAEAQYELGKMFNRGDNNQDIEKALKWYHKAAEQGCVDAFVALGGIYGDDENYNREKALKWYHKAAEQGNIEAYLSLAYIYGDDTPCNFVEVMKWCNKVVEQGNDNDIDECGDLLNDLGSKYFNGSGTTKDYRNAVECFRKAAEIGNVYAQFNLALAYYHGKGIEQNYSLAALFFTAAAKQGDVDAQYKMGGLCENGQGVSKNLEKAIEWYSKAAEQGHEDAKKSLTRVESKLNMLNKSKNRQRIYLSDLGIEIIRMALNNAFNDRLWQACGFDKVPERGAIFNVFVSSEKLAKETFLTREFIIAPLGIFVRKLHKLVNFPEMGYVKFLAIYMVNQCNITDSLKFDKESWNFKNDDIARNYFISYIGEYVKESCNLYDVFLKHCRNNNITPDQDMINGAQVVCDSLSNFLEQKVEEINNTYYIEFERDIRGLGLYASSEFFDTKF